MKLVYPIYLDTPMMTGFLASLEGGIVEEADLESKTGDAKEKTARGSLSANVSSLLSGILGGGAEIGLARKVSESLESHYKSTVRFPSTALFIRLRNLLMEQGQINVLESQHDLSDICVGDFIEFAGTALPNPAYQIRRAFSQLVPVIESYYRIVDSQIDQKLAELETIQYGNAFEYGGEEIIIQSRKQANAARSIVAADQKLKQSEAASYQQIGKVLTDLFPEGHTDTLLFKVTDFHAVCRVYSTFARNESIDEICDADWRCLGKVIGVISDSEEYDFLKGAPVSYIARDQFTELASALNNENLRIQTTEPVISGPGVVVATMAIFV